MSPKINIIGSGLTGPLLSTILAKKHNCNITMYERSSDCRISKLYSGRSINLALSNRGINALKYAGVYNKHFESLLIPMYGRVIHGQDGKQNFQAYGNKKEHFINSVSRIEINKILLNAAEKTRKVKLNFNMNCTKIDLNNHKIFFGKKVIIDNNPIIGADGYKSVVGDDIAKKNNTKINYLDIEHSYKELTIKSKNNEFQLDPNSLHIWPRKDMMMIALPNLDKSFTCTLFMKSKGIDSFESINNNNDLIKFFEINFHDLIPLIHDLCNNYFNNPVGKLIGVKSPFWYFKDKALIIGDAAHATVPFYGQGMNAAFEDCYVLSRIIENSIDSNWEDIFHNYSNNRKKDADTVLELSIENYKVMRNDVLDKNFLDRQKLSFILNEKFPKQFIPAYTMVSFTSIPYSLVLKRSKIQDIILEELLKYKLDDVINYDKEKSKKLINEHLSIIDIN